MKHSELRHQPRHVNPRIQVVSNIILPFGSLVILFFCVTKYGWGFDNYIEECNCGNGMKMPRIFKNYFKFVLPLIVLFIGLNGLF